MILTATVIVLIFGAGGAWVKLLNDSAKNATDLKGISGKVNQLAAEDARRTQAIAERNDRRYLTVCLVLIQYVPEKDRAVCAAMLDAGSE